MQLYEAEIPFLKEQRGEESTLNQEEVDKVYDIDNEGYNLADLDYKPIGKKLRIKIR